MASKKGEVDKELQKLNAARQAASARSSLEFAIAITSCMLELKRDVLNVQSIIAARETDSEKQHVRAARDRHAAEAELYWEDKAQALAVAHAAAKRQLAANKEKALQDFQEKDRVCHFKASKTLMDLKRTYDTLMWSKNFEKAILIKNELTVRDAKERAEWDAKQAIQFRYEAELAA